MKKIFFLLLIIANQSFAASTFEESWKELTHKICQNIINEKSKITENKALNLTNSKLLETTCSITANSAINECFPKLYDMYKLYSKTGDKNLVNSLTSKALDFCSGFANIPSAEIVNMIIESAKSKKISADEASKELILSLTPKK